MILAGITDPFGKLGPKRLGLTGQGSQIRAPLEQLIDHLQECPGTSEVAEGEVDAGKFDPV